MSLNVGLFREKLFEFHVKWGLYWTDTALFLRFIKRHTMTYEGVEVWLQTFVTPTLGAGELLASRCGCCNSGCGLDVHLRGIEL
jgi:hypothetical protein